MRILVVYFSWTGCTQAVADEVVQQLSSKHEVDICRIEPQKQRGYIRWLLLSFIPSSKVKILPVVEDTSKYDLIIVGSPKWTVSCPPVNSYLNRLYGCEGKTGAIFITYGGFDENRYLNGVVKKMKGKGVNVYATLLVKRSRVKSSDYHAKVKSFCREVESAEARRKKKEAMQ
jgi:flavodoxin